MATTTCTQECSKIEIRQLHHGVSNATKIAKSIYDLDNGITIPTESGELEYRKPGDKAGVTIIIANPAAIRECDACKLAISSRFRIPEFWWSDCCKRANGHFGFEEIPDPTEEDSEENKIEIHGCTSWALFQVKSFEGDIDPTYAWDKLNVFSRWYREKGHIVVLLFTQKANPLRDDFSTCLLEPKPKKAELKDPFWIYPRFANEVGKLESASVWSTRDMIRKVEKEREKQEKEKVPVEPKYSWLHDISRHVVHVSETLKVGTVSIQSIRDHHERFFETYPAKSDTTKPTEKVSLASRNIRNRLAFCQHRFQSNLHRSEANYARLQSETTLAFNKVSQEDSNVSVQIAHHTRTDSAAMRAIALVSMLFLPATFISAIFSTSFFSTTEQGIWRVSNKFWIYWLVSVLVTIATFAMWKFGRPYFEPAEIDPARRHSLSKKEKDAKEKERKESKKKEKKEKIESKTKEGTTVESQTVAPKPEEEVSENGNPQPKGDQMV